MAEVLVLVDHVDGDIKKTTYELLTAARALGEPSAVVVGPAGTADKLADGLTEHGAEKIYVAETDSTDFLSPETTVLESLVNSASPAAVLLAATGNGKEVAGRLAIRTNSGLLSDVVGVSADGVSHSIFGGAYTAEAKANTEHPVITVRPGSVEISRPPVRVPARPSRSRRRRGVPRR